MQPFKKSSLPKNGTETAKPESPLVEEQITRFRTDKWTRRVIRPLLIALMATSLSVALLVIAQIVVPEQSWMPLWVICFIAALETVYTTTWLNEPGSHGVDKFAYRAAEFFLILVVVRIFSWSFFGTGIPDRAELELMLSSPLTLLLSGGFFTSALATLAAWVTAGSLADTLTQLDLSVYEIRYYSLPLAKRKTLMDDQPIQVSRSILVDRFVHFWLSGGIALVFLTALSSFDLPQLATETNMLAVTRLGLHPAMLVALLFYFLSGFWLLSYARMSLMNARWLFNGVAKEENVERSWQRNSLVVLIAIAFMAALLPIGSTVPLGRIVAALFGLLLYLLRLLFVLLLTPLVWLLSQFGRDTAPLEELMEQPPPLQPPPLPPKAAAQPNELATLLFSSAFWTILVVVTIAAILFFLRERGYRLNRQELQRFWRQLGVWVRAMWDTLSGRAQRARQLLRLRLPIRRAGEALKPDGERPWRFIRLNTLSPREQIRYFYLSTVRRASDQGVKRRDSETPLEYGQDLKKKWPDAEGDLDDLTGAFMKARYSERPIEREEINPIKARWKRIRSRLHRNR